MRVVARLIGCLGWCVLLVSVFSSYYQAEREKSVLRRELNQRAEVLAESLQPRVEAQLQLGDAGGLQKLAQRFGGKEHLVGVAVYGEGEQAIAISAPLSGQVPSRPDLVGRAMREGEGGGSFLRVNGVPLHFRAVPLRDEGQVMGGLLIVHDASYIVTARRQAWRDMSVRL